jgi:hypothetical protein
VARSDRRRAPFAAAGRSLDLRAHHESEDVTIGYTRVVSNAKGYGPWAPQHRAWDNSHFDPNFVIEI